jgi:hypothetical protein
VFTGGSIKSIRDVKTDLEKNSLESSGIRKNDSKNNTENLSEI